jgi:hypothetical protein
LGLIVCEAAMAGAALQTSSASQNPNTRSSGAQRFSVIGCVERSTSTPAGGGGGASAPSFTITDVRGEKPAFRLDGDVKQLDIHVGHTAELRGSLSAASATGASSTSRLPVLKVESLVWIASRCMK